MNTDYYRSFISEIQFYQELVDLKKVKIWVKKSPEWIPYGQPLYLITAKCKSDTLKGMYYYPGKMQFFVEPFSFEINEIRYIINTNTDTKCVII